VTLARRVLQELSSLRFVEAHRNVVILGPVGVGKAFVASALGQVACRSGSNASFIVSMICSGYCDSVDSTIRERR